MKILIVEDDFITSQVMNEILQAFGDCSLAVNGLEGLNQYKAAFESGDQFDLIFLDIMMPEMDGQETLHAIRKYEKQMEVTGLAGVKVIMTTALDDFENIKKSFQHQCEGYLVKPIDKDKIINIMVKLDLLA